MTAGWVWIELDVVLAVHDRQLAEHGGSVGIRDEGLLVSALAKPQNLDSYGKPDAADLAAAYAFGIAKNHPFVDGNKRAAWVVARLFLVLNGSRLTFEPWEAVKTMEGVAGGMVDEPALAAWFRARLTH